MKKQSKVKHPNRTKHHGGRKSGGGAALAKKIKELADLKKAKVVA